jgi:CBS domain-containing protein
VNIVLAGLLYIWLSATASFEPLQTMTLTTGPFLERLLVVNLFLVVFNMIPAFPMDGGRVLRALLATRKDYARATRIAASIGQGVAVFFGFVGLFYNPMLLLIAFFVWIGAAQESGSAQIQNALGGIPVQQAMLTDFKTLDRTDRLDKAIEVTLAGSQKDFPVVDNGSVMGILTQRDLLKALSNGDEHAPVIAAMQEGFVTVSSLDMLETAFDKLQDCNCQTLPVTQNGKLVGLLTMDNLGEFMRFQSALKN